MEKLYDDALLVAEYRKCRRCRVVAEKFGCSNETVRRALIKFGEPRIIRHPRKETKAKASEEELNTIIKEYYETDADINELAKKYHRAQGTISKAIKELGHGLKKNAINSAKITDEQLIEACKTMTRQKIADNYGMHIASVDRRMSKLGVHALPADNSSHTLFCDRKGNFGDCWHFVESQWRRFEVLHPGFEYLETRSTESNTRVRLKCKKCGTIIERAESTLRKRQIRCEQCEADRKLNEARQSVAHVINAIAFSLTPRICKHCGETFTSANPYQIYCSKKCARKSKGNSIRKRCRKYGVYYDPSVKSELVFKRDGMVCQICGKKCDPMDHIWGDTGPLYPSVDHIIPLAKGGTHTWGNVQTAHIICNSFKCDSLGEEASCG